MREAKGEASAQLIDHLKKPEMAKEAERLLDGSGWLPEPLRRTGLGAPADETPSETDALPAFLAEVNENEEESDEATSDPEEPLPHAIAAE